MQKISIDFNYGRLDVCFESVEAIKRGDDFKIIEINGISSEPSCLWDYRKTGWQKYKLMIKNFNQLYAIGAYKMKSLPKDKLFKWRLLKDFACSLAKEVGLKK